MIANARADAKCALRRYVSVFATLALLVVVPTAPAAAGSSPVRLVKDIVPGRAGASPEWISPVGRSLFFTAWDPKSGRELWKTNGTKAGTVMVKDIWPGSKGSSLRYGSVWPSEMEGILYFAAKDGTHGGELWRSDGTGAGTIMVKDIFPGSDGSLPTSSAAPTDVGGTLFFTADDGTYGVELWRSDGTEAGTVMVKDIRLGSESSFPSALADVGGTLYFAADDGTHGRHGSELWKSDGTEAGTVMVKEMRPLGEFTIFKGAIYFVASVGYEGQLWRTDGTETGTVMVKHFNGEKGYPEWLTVVDDTLFFSANDGVRGRELWKSDGTEAGTVMVKNIVADGKRFPESGPGSYPAWLTNMAGALYFATYDDPHGGELWKSDGTKAGTVMVKDINPGKEGSHSWSLVNVSGTLIFTADDGTHGVELWTSDGTEAGTVMVKDLYRGVGSSYPGWITDLGGKVFFSATTPATGYELWAARTDPYDDGFRSVGGQSRAC